MTAYLDLARQGKNNWWRYALALFIIAFFWVFIGSVPYLALGIYANSDLNDGIAFDLNTGQFTGINPIVPFIALMLSFVMFLVGIFIAVRFVHGRPFSSLISPRIRWGQFALAFGLWLGLAAFISLVEALLYPGRYQLTFDPVYFMPFVVAVIFLVPLQTSAEELFFRGYLLQWVGLRVRNIVVLSLISGLLFMLPHLANPEVSVDLILLPLFYFGFGAFLAFISLKDNGLELALGVHAANNMFTAIFANYAGSALLTPALFMANELDPVYSLVSVVLAMGVFYLIIFWLPQPKAQPAG